MKFIPVLQPRLTESSFSTKGFSVVELMVALAITAFLLIGLVQIFSSVRASYDLQEGLARIQENARFADSFMTRHLQSAGRLPYANNQRAAAIGQLNPEDTIPVSSLAYDPVLNGSSEGNGTDSDSIEASYYTNIDCSGTQLGNPVHKIVMFALNDSNEITYSCRTGPASGATAPAVIIDNQPIISNVETLQFQYGHDQGRDELDGRFDTSVDRYTNFGASLEGVIAIRVGLILTSPVIGTLPLDNQDIELFGTTFSATGEPHLRRAIVFNINLRNLTL